MPQIIVASTSPNKLVRCSNVALPTVIDSRVQQALKAEGLTDRLLDLSRVSLIPISLPFVMRRIEPLVFTMHHDSVATTHQTTQPPQRIAATRVI